MPTTIANTQIQNVQTFASQGCDVIIVNLVKTDNAQQIIEAANGIPIVFVNRMPGVELEAAGIRATYVYEDTAEWDRSKAQNKMQTFIGTGQTFDCVITNNDEMALGAIEAMKASGLDLSVIPVAGIDATPAGLEAMSRGELAFSVFQNPVGQGGGCVRAATLIANGDVVDTVVDIPFEPVSATNFKDYMN